MTRKEFIVSEGGTCSDWGHSWSFINHRAGFVIFGAWDVYSTRHCALILDPAWVRDQTGRRTGGYAESLRNIKLIEEHGYRLMIFRISYSDADRVDTGIGPARTDGYLPQLEEVSLVKSGGKYYAYSRNCDDRLAEIDHENQLPRHAERKTPGDDSDQQKKSRCIENFGNRCVVCSFSFDETYGRIGDDIIQVHRVGCETAGVGTETAEPTDDLRPLCPNCHAAIHSRALELTIDELKEALTRQRAEQPTD